MKKGLLGLSAFIFAAALVGCSADKEKNADNKDKAETTTVAEETSASAKDEDVFDDEDDKDNNKKNKKDNKTEITPSSISIKDISGPYHKTGHAYSGDYPDELDTIDNDLKDDPVTISEDGTLHFCGKDYKLIDGVTKKEADLFAIEGSGFDSAKYKGVFSCKADKDYEGPCAFAKVTSHMTVNDEDRPYDSYMLFLKQKGTKDCFGYIMLDTGDAPEDSWSFDLDDDDLGFDDNTTEE